MRDNQNSAKKPRAQTATKKNRLNANSEPQVPRPKLPVDFRKGESVSLKKPIRPQGWKRKKIYRGKLSLQVDWRPVDESQKVNKRLEYRLTIASAHRPAKSDFEHFEASMSFKKQTSNSCSKRCRGRITLQSFKSRGIGPTFA